MQVSLAQKGNIAITDTSSLSRSGLVDIVELLLKDADFVLVSK